MSPELTGPKEAEDSSLLPFLPEFLSFLQFSCIATEGSPSSPWSCSSATGRFQLSDTYNSGQRSLSIAELAGSIPGHKTHPCCGAARRIGKAFVIELNTEKGVVAYGSEA